MVGGGGEMVGDERSARVYQGMGTHSFRMFCPFRRFSYTRNRISKSGGVSMSECVSVGD